jgi:5'-phosphate synthase pdxT subunit
VNVSSTIGVLALQGAFAAHLDLLSSLDVVGRPVRLPSDLEGLDGLILPGGESTTMSNLLRSYDLLGPLSEFISAGHPVFGTCAGMILLSDRILDGRADQIALKSIDIVVRRNGYGRQVDSFETDIDVDGFDSAFHAVFIRAPRIEEVGPDVDVLARHEGVPVLVRQGTVMAASFHPELTNDDRIHRLFADMVRGASSSGVTTRDQVR